MKLTQMVAPVAAVALTLGLTACSSPEDTSAQTSASAQSSSAASSSAAATTETTVVETEKEVVTKVAEEDLVETTLADGTTAKIPAAVQAEADAVGDLGAAESVESDNNGVYVVKYGNGRSIVFSPEHGANLLQGMIAQAWEEAGGMKSDVGLPVEDEKAATGAEGWTQEFENGTISWINQNGTWAADTTLF